MAVISERMSLVTHAIVGNMNMQLQHVDSVSYF